MVERQRLNPPVRRDPTPTLVEYEEGLTIDEHALQRDCRNQPELFYQIAKAVGRARGEYESAKVAHKRVQAETEITIRTEAEELEARLTEAKCASLVMDAPAVRRAADLVTECNAKVETLQALKEAYIHRRDMLKELVQLHISNYYADPVRGSESRLRDSAVAGVRASRRRDQENE